MGLFDRFKGKKTVDWSAAYTAEPKFYGRPSSSSAVSPRRRTASALPSSR